MGYSTEVVQKACPDCGVVQEVERQRHSQGGVVGVVERHCPVCGYKFGGDDGDA